jgi:uncharacterized protein involved in exopolysaccharide biosynthesis
MLSPAKSGSDQIVNDAELQRNVREAVQGAPSGYFVIVPASQDQEVIDLRTLLSLVGQRWKLLLTAMFLSAAVAAAISLVMRPIYRVQVVLAPTTQGDSGSLSLPNQLGGLAALAGVDLGGTNDRKQESIATLASMRFARDFIVEQNLLPILFEESWDADNDRWGEGDEAPTLEAGVKKFTERVRSISEDGASGLIVVTVEWHDPELAALWANQMVDMLNERLRARAISEAERNTEYLNEELAKTNVLELRQAIYRLIQEQVNNAMLANVQRDYAFRVIDPAVQPETRARPKRTAMTLVGAVLGLVLGIIVILSTQRLGRAE